MLEHKTEHESTAFEEFWSWKDDQGIGTDEEDWRPWWECFLAGYKYAVLTTHTADKDKESKDIWTNEDEVASIEKQIVEDARR